ncbi:MAG: hypothetical protein MJ057_06095 [Sphaerochaetaceae bacterium]|nr:hypothetical protein [Sphaerochaetaceae bacterium]
MISLFGMMSVFAGGANEARLYYLPRNVANNRSVMIELTEQKALTVGNITTNYSNTSTNNLAIFRLRNSLNDGDQPAPGNIVMTISSEDGWYFVNENNPTSKRSFELNAFCVEEKNVNRDYSTTVSTQALGTNTTLTNSSATASFRKVGNTYQLSMPRTTFSRDRLSMFSAYIREYDICVKIPDTNTELETGYYQTTLTITTTQYYEHETKVSWGVANLERDGGVRTMTETITIRGYVGLDPEMDNSSYSFSVSSASDTYTMDLGITSQTTPYNVADVQFSHLELVNSDPTSSENTLKNKFTIYISPTSDYTASGEYRFIKMNSENQARTAENTIYYDLYVNTSSGFQKFSAITSRMTFPDGSIGSAGVGTPATTFKILPVYSSDQISQAGAAGGSDQWKETWILDQNIYLKLTNASLQATHQSGLYYSYIYFTLVAN